MEVPTPPSDTCKEKPIYFIYFFRRRRSKDQQKKTEKTFPHNIIFGSTHTRTCLFPHICLHISVAKSHTASMCAYVRLSQCFPNIFLFRMSCGLPRVIIVYPPPWRCSDGATCASSSMTEYSVLTFMARKCLTIFVYIAINFERT